MADRPPARPAGTLAASPLGGRHWSNPKLVCQVAFVEWTDAEHLRHCTFVAMRDNKRPAEAIRET